MTHAIVDVDGHVLEPADLWQSYLEPRFRERAIRIETDAAGLEVLLIDGKPFEMLRGLLGSLGGIHLPGEEALVPGRHSYADGCPPGGYDAQARLSVMDDEQVDVSLLYPTIGLIWEDIVRDAELSIAYARAYNRWLADWCRTAPERLYPIAHLPLLDPELAVAEAERARKDGCVGIYLSPDLDARGGRPLHDPGFDRLWAAAQDLDMPIAFHVVVRQRPIFADWEPALESGGRLFYHAFLAIDVMAAFTQMLTSGVFERFPRLRCAVLEAGSNWISSWLDRLDHKYEVAPGVYPMKLKPSDYFRRQCVISADPDETMTADVARHIGTEYCVWASDYPHIDASLGAVAELRENLAGLDEREERLVLGENAQRFYGLAS
ncbi:MAG: amidohydrolase [Myxococcales bacterium]|nr:amidohydrolase [Myxococcales bacterium]